MIAAGGVHDEVVADRSQPASPSRSSEAGLDPAPPGQGQGRWSRWSWRHVVAVGLAVVVILPIVVAGINGLLRPWFPAGDWAIGELRTFDVGSAHTPLVGPYSRYSWNHPGPLLFWLFAVPYRLTGLSSSSLLLAASLVNAASVAAILALAWRRGRLALVAPLSVALALLIHTMAPAYIRDPWNAWVTVLPTGVLVIAVWSAIEGDRWGLPLVAGVGAFLVQSHIGFLPLAAVALVVAGFGAYRRSRDWRCLRMGAAVFTVAWLPSLVGLLTGDPNVSKILAHFGSDASAAGWGTALGVVALELGYPAVWLGAPEAVNASGGGLQLGPLSGLVLPLIVYVVAAVGAWRIRAGAAVRLQLVVIGAIAVGLVAVSRITDDVFGYLVHWFWPIGALAAAAAAWSLWCVARTWLAPDADADADAGAAATMRRRAGEWAARIGALVVALVVIVVSVQTAGGAGEARLPVDDWYASLHVVAPEATAAVPKDRPVLVRATGPLAGWVLDALSLQLARDGFDVRVEDEGINRYKFGDFRVVPEADASMRGVWMVTGSRIEDFDRSPQATRVARFDPLSPDERREANELDHRLRAVYRAAGRDDLVHQLDDGVSLFSEQPVPGIDPAELDRYEVLRRAGVPVAVFMMDHADQSPPEGPT